MEIEKRCMTDCLNEDEDDSEDGDESSENDRKEKESEDIKTESKQCTNSAKSSPKPRKRITRSSNKSNQPQQSPSTPISTTKASAFHEYVVDQKGIGSETLVVKSAATSRRDSLAGSPSPARNNKASNLAPRQKQQQNCNTVNSQFNPNSNSNQHDIYTPPQLTTQSHPLFPNYPRTLGLPSLDTQFDFNLINNDLNLTALNANDFNLMGMWGNVHNQHTSSINGNNNYFDHATSYGPISDIPRYQSDGAVSGSQNPMNNIVSDLFGDISMF